MTHAEKTWRLWQRMQHQGTAYDRWSAFFVSLIDDPETAEKLCELGMRVVRREMVPGAAARLQVEAAMGSTLIG